MGIYRDDTYIVVLTIIGTENYIFQTLGLDRHLIDHVRELLLFVLVQLLEVFGVRNVQLVSRLRLRRFERTRQDGDLCVTNHLQTTKQRVNERHKH